jgi:hypothetical protein
MNFDPVTEAIAHFVGYFHIKVEEVRLRDQYAEFKALQAAAQRHPDLPDAGVTTLAPYRFKEFDPGVRYESAPEPLFKVPGGPIHATASWYEPDTMPHPALARLAPMPELHHYGQPMAMRFEFPIMPPGSIAVVVNQYNSLDDNDFLTMVSRDVAFKPVSFAVAELTELAATAKGFQALSDFDHPSGESAIGDVILSAYSQSVSFTPLVMEGLTANVFHGDAVQGVHINGAIAAATPDLDDYLPKPPPADAEAEATNYVQGEGAITIQVSTTLEAGANTLVNEAFIGNSWTVSPVIAVVGDYVHVDIISQVNIVQDIDSIGTTFSTWAQDTSEATLTFNIASYLQETSGDATASAGGSLIFPTTWSVTTITGNLVFLNWIEQLNFVTDNDVAILSNSGSASYTEMGGNLAANGLSLFALGQYYDLIIIGGKLYTGNIISQTNILLDDDDISAEDGVSMSGTGTLSTQDNLLWNEASITTIGDVNVQSLPDAYAQAAQALANGDDSLIANLLQNAEFAGLAGLKVLYIEGDIYNLQYIKQTNILGDADQVIVAAEQAQATLPGEWSVETGSNALINIASITDAGPDGILYVGGETYSDALLYQAEFISADAGTSISSGDALVSEAVIFLAEGMLDAEGSDTFVTHTTDANAATADIMQSVTS